jgi:pimeloyl-ACP methyl ester carboxylesterase
VEAIVDLGGVRTWYAVHGTGDPLVYLHGGFSDSRELGPLRPRYAERFRVHTPDRRGHGRSPDVDGPFDFERVAADTIAFVEHVVGGPAHLIGFSDGATTALHVALRRPDLVRRLVLISGQYHADGLLPGLLPPDFADDPAAAAATMTSSRLARRYGEVSPDGPEHFLAVTEKILRMAATEPRLEVADLAGVRARTLVVCADDDAVAPEHTLALYRGIPDAELAVVPGTSHVLISEKPELVAQLVLGFLTTDPRPTIAPIRRRR